MARIIFTNNRAKFDIAVKNNRSAGLRDYETLITESFSLAVFKKRAVKTDNFLQLENGDFVASAGTIIYKELFGKACLSAILSDFSNDIEAIRSNVIGNYLLVIKKSDVIYAFVDKYQILKTYYFEKSGTWFLSNSLSTVGSVLDTIELNEFAFIQETLHNGVVGKQAIFKDVFQLYGIEFAKFCNKKRGFSINPLGYKREKRNLEALSIDEIVEEYASKVKKHFGVLAKTFGDKIGLHMTGGLDTRTVLSSFLSVGMYPRLYYGRGNSRITNTKEEDFSLVKEISAKLKLNFEAIDWSNDYTAKNNFWEECFNKHGFYYKMYGCNPGFFKKYEAHDNDSPCFYEFGYYGENLRTREWIIDQKIDNFSFDDFISKYHINQSLSQTNYPRFNDFVEYLSSIYNTHSTLYNIPRNTSGGYHINQFDEFRQISHRSISSVSVNFINEFAPSIAMFSVHELYEYPFDIPAKYRSNGQFQLRLINKLFPEALNVPIFSHCQHQKFDKASFSLTPQVKLAFQIHKKLKQSGITGLPYKLARKTYNLFTSDKSFKQNEQEKVKVKNMLIKSIQEDSKYVESPINPELFNGDIRQLMSYALHLHGVRLIIENR